ncbi:MAG: hypothetical protein RAP70_07425 [Candidatus Celaenobacter antarcticus]|nr:hypothetical protein [Candidatus Celaenobacter antarcticus]
MDYGTKALDKLLKFVDKMSVEDYKRAYEEALKDMSEFDSIKSTSSYNFVNSINIDYLQINYSIKAKEENSYNDSSSNLISSAA